MKKLRSGVITLIMIMVLGCITAMAAETTVTVSITDENGDPEQKVVVDSILIVDDPSDFDDEDSDALETDNNGEVDIALTVGESYIIFPSNEKGYSFSPEYQMITAGDTKTVNFRQIVDPQRDIYWLMILSLRDKDTDQPLTNFPILIDGVRYTTDGNGLFIGSFSEYKEYVITTPESDSTLTIDESSYNTRPNSRLTSHYSFFRVDMSGTESEPLDTATPSDATPTTNTSSGSTGSSHRSSSSGSSSSGSSSSGSSSSNAVVAINWTYFPDIDRWTLDNFAYKSQWIYAYNPYATDEQGKYDWFHFDDAGYMDDGWFTDADGNVYYLNIEKDNTRGKMMTGWQVIDGRSYYFNEISDGTMGAMVTSVP